MRELLPSGSLTVTSCVDFETDYHDFWSVVNEDSRCQQTQQRLCTQRALESQHDSTEGYVLRCEQDAKAFRDVATAEATWFVCSFPCHYSTYCFCKNRPKCYCLLAFINRHQTILMLENYTTEKFTSLLKCSQRNETRTGKLSQQRRLEPPTFLRFYLKPKMLSQLLKP